MKSNSFLLAALFLLCALFSLSAAAEDAPDKTTSAKSEATQVSPETWRSFENLFSAISQAEQDLAGLRKQLNEAKNDAERDRIRNDINLMESNIDSLQLAWEMWATGGTDWISWRQSNFSFRRRRKRSSIGARKSNRCSSPSWWRCAV